MTGSYKPALTAPQLAAYMERLGIDLRGAAPDHDTLRTLHLAHLDTIPFENLDIVFGPGVPHDQHAAIDKITGTSRGTGRGGWCFELNGALALLLESLGYHVHMLGAAVLLDGPSEVIEHLLLEVTSPHLAPHLVDVGFGDSFDVPLALNTPGPQDGGSGTFELIASPQGTTLTRHIDAIPAALLRFKRVAHPYADFAPVATSMQHDPHKHWGSRPFATRRLRNNECTPPTGASSRVQRVSLTRERLKIQRGNGPEHHPVPADRWDTELATWFAMTLPHR